MTKFKGVTLEEQISIQLDRVIHSNKFKKTVLRLYIEDWGIDKSNAEKKFNELIKDYNF